jgi:DNA-binding winged helix-turn-helix (wHTH) protein
MTHHRKFVAQPNHHDFEFDRNRNVVFFKGDVIYLTPHEADLLAILLDNRERPTPIEVLIQGLYGDRAPGAAAVSIRVAVHMLRKKILPTGMIIRAESRVGYEIDASAVPGLNRSLSDHILSALNLALAAGEAEMAERLKAVLDLAEAKREKSRDLERLISASRAPPGALWD